MLYKLLNTHNYMKDFKLAKKRILYIEDNPEISNLISMILSDYEVFSALSMSDGLQRAYDEKFELYLVDYQLPDGTGFDLTLSIRNFNPKTPILFVTGAGSITEEQVIGFGANGLIKKESKMFVHELPQKVSQLLDKTCRDHS